MSNILFLDIDGVVLPGRAYMLPNQTNDPFVTVFDPCAVSMLNKFCSTMLYKIVVHSSWVKHHEKNDLWDHLRLQGVDTQLLHSDWYCDPQYHWRWDRVRDWLSRHKEVNEFVILDDEKADDQLIEKHLVVTDFNEGITMDVYDTLYNRERWMV